jgi:hypothetical protein
MPFVRARGGCLVRGKTGVHHDLAGSAYGLCAAP